MRGGVYISTGLVRHLAALNKAKPRRAEMISCLLVSIATATVQMESSHLRLRNKR